MWALSIYRVVKPNRKELQKDEDEELLLINKQANKIERANFKLTVFLFTAISIYPLCDCTQATHTHKHTHLLIH